MILDIHTHHPAPQPDAVVCSSPEEFAPMEGQLYSTGIHPWTVAEGFADDLWDKLTEIASIPCVKAIGECGIDLPKGGILYRQMLVFRKHIELSEKVGKPLIIHCVKAQDILIGIKKEFKPTQPWLVHGFRGKPTIAKMLTDVGIYLSFGECFNAATLSGLPDELIFAETDESSLTITEIVARLSEVKGKDLTDIISRNTSRFLNL